MTVGFTVLCVCTGNICRSPAAERLLTAALGAEVGVSSAGTLARVGQWIEPPMDRLIVLAGADASDFEARRLREPMVRAADLILTMTDAHTGDVIDMWPRAVRKTFTIGEFARVLNSLEPTALPRTTVAERLRAALPVAAASPRSSADRTRDDVADPYRQHDKVYEQAFDAIRDAVNQIARVIVMHREPERL